MEVAAESAVASLRFAREAIATVIGEVAPLAALHWDEVGHYRDMPLAVDFPKYERAEREGVLRIYTARADQRLVGYGIYLIGTALHYADVITAQQATLFVHPEHRPGDKFIAYTELMLGGEGVQIIVQHVKAGTTEKGKRRALAFCRLLEHRRYELQDYLLTKRL